MQYRRYSVVRWLCAGLALCALAFWVSPYVAATRFAQAAATGDAVGIAERLDIPRLRMAFAKQIVRAYPVDPVLVAALDPAARYAANLVAASYVDALIAEHLTPEAIIAALAAPSKASASLGGQGLNLPAMQRIGGVWDIVMASGFTGLTSFAVDVPAQPEGRYRLGFRLGNGGWKLASIGLPAGVLARAVELLKQRGSAARLG